MRVLTVLLSAGIAASASLLASPLAAAQPSAGPADGAQIYIFRRDDQPVAEDVAVGIDARRLGPLANGTHVVVTVAPGLHTVRAGSRAMTTLLVNAQANRTYYVWLQALPGVRPLATELTLVNERTARPLLVVSMPLPVELAPAPPAAKPAPAVPSAPPAAATGARAEPARPVPGAERGAIALLLGAGAFALDEPRQQVGGAPYQFEEDSDRAFAGALEYRHVSGVAIGGELFLYRHTVSIPAASSRGEQDVVGVVINAKYYRSVADFVYPFVGAGFGAATNRFSGDFSGSGSGVAAQLMAGVELRFKNAGLYAQYKKLSADLEDDGGQRIDIGGDGILAGLSLSFGL